MSSTLVGEGENGAATYSIQGGPAYSAVDAASSSDLEFSGVPVVLSPSRICQRLR